MALGQMEMLKSCLEVCGFRQMLTKPASICRYSRQEGAALAWFSPQPDGSDKKVSVMLQQFVTSVNFEVTLQGRGSLLLIIEKVFWTRQSPREQGYGFCYGPWPISTKSGFKIVPGGVHAYTAWCPCSVEPWPSTSKLWFLTFSIL